MMMMFRRRGELPRWAANTAPATIIAASRTGHRLAIRSAIYDNPRMYHPVSRIIDLLDPSLNRIDNMTIDEARRRLADHPAGMRDVRGSFALVTSQGVAVRLARSLDRPMRYFLAKRHAGPALYVADRIDALHAALAADGLDAQFHPSYTRMVPAHYVVEIALVGCPDPDPIYTRFFTPQRNRLPASLDEIGRQYVSAMADEIERWLR